MSLRLVSALAFLGVESIYKAEYHSGWPFVPASQHELECLESVGEGDTYLAFFSVEGRAFVVLRTTLNGRILE